MTARDAMLIPYDLEADIEIDLGEVRVEATGRFLDESLWDGRTLDIAQLSLVAWQWEGKWHTRERLVKIVGNHALTAEEQRITGIWSETAEADRADYLADQAREARRDMEDYA